MKKYLIGLFAVVLAVGFTAFTKDETKMNLDKKFVGSYFSYVGPNFTLVELRKPSNYSLLAPTPAVCPLTVNLCWIFVDASNIYPANHATFPNKPKVDDATTTILTRITQPEGTYTLPTEIIERKQ